MISTEEKYLVVVNPVGRGGHAQRQGIWLLDRFRRMGIDHEALFTEKGGHARELVCNWADRIDVVVAVGGDGTVNEVINGIMTSRNRDCVLAVLPSGTADDFARNMGIPREKEKALKVLLGDSEKKIDLMLVNGERYASVTVGMGLDAEIAYRAYGSKHLRLLAYWYHGLSMIFKPIRTPRMRVKVAGNTFEGECFLAVAANARSYGRYMKMIPQAKMDDGIINMVFFEPLSKAKALLLFAMSMFGGHTWASEMSQYEDTEIVIECLEDFFAQFDGEVMTFKAGERLEMKVEPQALRVRAPTEGR